MYFLVNTCENPNILRLLYFVNKLLDLVFILLPIGLIIFITIDIVKAITGDEKTSKSTNKSIISRLIFAVMLFFVPTIVTLVTNLLDNVGLSISYNYTDPLTKETTKVSYHTCIDNSKDLDKINNVFQKKYDEEQKKLDEEMKNNLN